MENKYHYNYFNSINEGLNNSIYYLKNVKSEPELFFDTINNILKTLKTDRNKVYLEYNIKILKKITHKYDGVIICVAHNIFKKLFTSFGRVACDSVLALKLTDR